MFNYLFIVALINASGRRLPQLYSQVFGESERTWRDRFKAWKWEPGAELPLHERAKARFRQRVLDAGLSGESVEAVLSRIDGVGAAWCFVDMCDVGLDDDRYAQAKECARKCDELTLRYELIQSRNDDKALAGLIDDGLDWIGQWDQEGSTSLAIAKSQQFDKPYSKADLMAIADALADDMYLLVLSRVDRAMAQQYFQFEPKHSLLRFVLPRMAPGVTLDLDNSTLLRSGTAPRRGYLETSMSRFLDVMAILASRQKFRRWPDKIPSSEDVVAWGGTNLSSDLVKKWRSQRTKLTLKRAKFVWRAIAPERSQFPIGFYLVAKLFEPGVLYVDGKLRIFILEPRYLAWWKVTHPSDAMGRHEQAAEWPPVLL